MEFAVIIPGRAPEVVAQVINGKLVIVPPQPRPEKPPEITEIQL